MAYLTTGADVERDPSGAVVVPLFDKVFFQKLNELQAQARTPGSGIHGMSQADLEAKAKTAAMLELMRQGLVKASPDAMKPEWQKKMERDALMRKVMPVLFVGGGLAAFFFLRRRSP